MSKEYWSKSPSEAATPELSASIGETPSVCLNDSGGRFETTKSAPDIPRPKSSRRTALKEVDGRAEVDGGRNVEVDGTTCWLSVASCKVNVGSFLKLAT